MVATQDAGGAQSAGLAPTPQQLHSKTLVRFLSACYASRLAACTSPSHVTRQHRCSRSSRCCTKAGHATGPLHPGDPLLGGGVTGVDICCDAAGAPGPGYRSPNEAAWLSDLINDACPPCSSSTRSALLPCAVQDTFLPGFLLHPCSPGGHSWHSCIMYPLLQPACSSMRH